jgi:hypothetical protein
MTEHRSGRGWAAGLARPHTWPCRHCEMVTDYHLERDSQLRRAESLDRRDEIDRLIVFKDWLRAYEWQTEPPEDADADQGENWADDADEWARADVSEPGNAATGDADPLGAARRAVDALPVEVDLDDDPAAGPGRGSADAEDHSDDRQSDALELTS